MLRKIRYHICSLALCAGLLLLQPQGAQAQENGAATAASTEAPALNAVTLADVQAQRSTIEASTTLEDSVKAQVLARYDQAIQSLQAGEEWRARTAEFERLIAEAPQRLQELQQADATEAEQEGEPAPEVTEDSTLAEVEKALAAAEAQLAVARSAYEQTVQEPSRHAERRRQVPELQVAANQRLQEAKTALGTAPATTEAPELVAARRAELQARVQVANTELTALQRELAAYDARAQIIDLLQVDARRKLSQAESAVQSLRNLAAQKRKSEAQLAVEAAYQQVRQIIDVNPLIHDTAQALAERNRELAELRTGPQGLTVRIEETQALLEEANARHEQVDKEFDRIRERVAAGGLNSAVGALLRRQKAELPDAGALRRDVRERRKEIADAEIAIDELQDSRIALADLEVDLWDRLAQIPDLSQLERGELNGLVADLLSTQRTLLDALQNDYDKYYDVLTDLSTSETQLANLAEQLREYINENIFWVAGNSPLTMRALGEGLEAARWLMDVDAWRRVPPFLFQDMGDNVPIYLLMVLLLLFLLVARRGMRRRIQALGEAAEGRRVVEFSPTLQAFGLTVLASAVLPFVIGLYGSRLAIAAEPVPQAAALGWGIRSASYVFLLLELLRLVFMSKGLGAAHFGWPASRMLQARIVLGALLAIAAPLIAIVFMFENQPDELYKESAGRVAYIAALLVTAAALHILASLGLLAMQDLRRENWYTEHTVMRRLARAMLLAVPLVLAILSAAGYYYTALQLGMRFFETFAVLLVAMLLVSLVRRWLLLTRRRLAIEQARRRREAAKLAAESGDGITLEADLDKELDIVRVDAQTQGLIRFTALIGIMISVYFIWSDVIPALGFLQRIEIWSAEPAAVAPAAPADGSAVAEGEPAPATAPATSSGAVTLLNLFLAILILIVMYAALRNLPGFLEIILAQRFNMASGERYATVAVVRYSLIAIGVVAAFNVLGVGWSKMQWLVAALGVGLGFGLQEIFANFVSGLILLFERPMRVGDIVTVNNVSGVVSQIRIRATTIIDWDKKELIVPNKAFVTGQVQNWTLNEPLLRVVIKVGVAYGTDPQKVVDSLLQIAREHPTVVADPAPAVFFMNFGESSLNFELRCFSPNVAESLPIMHDLNLAIVRRFKEEEFGMPFPVRNLHVQSGLEPIAEAIREQGQRLGSAPEKKDGD